jgi:predicted ATPase
MSGRRAVDFTGFVMQVAQVRGDDWEDDAYPFQLPAIASWRELDLHPKVTFLVGENGSGKSTLIEAIAIAAGLNAEGGSRNHNFLTVRAHSGLDKFLRLVRGYRRPKDSFFLRAESFFNVATNIDDLDALPASGPPLIDAYGGVSLHQQSHGESFLALMENRLRGNGFYVLDEPEAALSPQRQLRFLRRLHALVKADSQLVIATHSPILLAYPDAWIYEMTPEGPERKTWDALMHVKLTRDFLMYPEGFLWDIMEEDGER